MRKAKKTNSEKLRSRFLKDVPLYTECYLDGLKGTGVEIIEIKINIAEKTIEFWGLDSDNNEVKQIQTALQIRIFLEDLNAYEKRGK